MTRNIRILLACAVALLAVGAGGLAALMLIPDSAPRISRSLGAAIGGPFTLTATDGRTVTDETYRGKWLLIYFGYISCPDACPTALNNMGVALDRLGPEADGLQPLFITVDPRRDIPAVLSEYMKSFDPRIVALTGTEDQIAAVAAAYHVYYAAPRNAEGNDYFVGHSSYIYLMDPRGRLVKPFSSELAAEGLADQLHILMARSS